MELKDSTPAPKRRSNTQVVEGRLRKGGMPESAIADVLKALEAGKHSVPALPGIVELVREEKRPLVVPVAVLTTFFGEGVRAFTLRPYRRTDGRMAASLMPGAPEAAEEPPAPLPATASDPAWERDFAPSAKA